jgi:hypothetical protein
MKIDIDTANTIQVCLTTLICGIFSLGVRFLFSISKSINQLNVQVAVILDKTMTHEKGIDHLDKRVTRLETKKDANRHSHAN